MAQLEKHPLHQCRIKQFNKEKEQIEQYINTYQDKYNFQTSNIDDFS